MDNAKEGQILQAAKSAFEELGYKGTTIEQIARIAKMGKGTIYTVFKTKEEIFNHVVDAEIKKILSTEKERFIDNQEYADLHETIYDFFMIRTHNPLVKKLLYEFKAHNTPEAGAALKKVERETQKQLEEFITLFISKNKLKPYRVDLVAFLIGEIYKVLLTTWEEDHPPLTREEMGQVFEEFIVKGIGMGK